MRMGALNLLIPNPRDIAGFVKELGKYKVNMLPGGQHAVQRAGATIPDFDNARFLGPEDLRTAAAWRCSRRSPTQLAEPHGLPIIEGYGLSETSPVATCNPVDSDRLHRHDRPADAVDRDRDPATTTATTCRSGSAGEIAIRGPQVMAGYWNRPDETAKVDDAGRLLQAPATSA